MRTLNAMRNRLKSAANRDLKFIDFFKLYVIYIGVVDLIVYLGILKNSNKFLFLAIPIFILILLSGVDGFLRTIKNLSQIAAVRWTLFSGFGTAFITAVTVTYYAGEANNRFINSLAWLSINRDSNNFRCNSFIHKNGGLGPREYFSSFIYCGCTWSSLCSHIADMES